MSFNRSSVELFGNLTQDPKLKKTHGGISVCDVPLAINDGPENSEATFVVIQVWKGWAESLVNTAQKGALVYCKGRLKTQSWTDQESKKVHSRIIVVCERAIHFQQPRYSSNEKQETQAAVQS